MINAAVHDFMLLEAFSAGLAVGTIMSVVSLWIFFRRS